jgi:cytochrome c-type biogenesis protein
VSGGGTLMAGSAAAAFVAGMIAFFAPCCSGVMMPTYLAAVSGGSRMRVARLTAVYVAGVALVVWPITLGAGAVGEFTSSYHPQLFVIGGLMMLFTAATLWRGSMLPLPIPQPELTGTAVSVFVLGMFSGAATACCAPVLAGAVALSALSGSWVGGVAMGGAYILGIVFPLVILALLFEGARRRVRDPRLTLHVGGWAKRISLSRLIGAAVFGASGIFFIGLAFSGEARNAPAFQKRMGVWLDQLGTRAGDVPNSIAWPALALFAVTLVYLVLRPGTKEAHQ